MNTIYIININEYKYEYYSKNIFQWIWILFMNETIWIIQLYELFATPCPTKVNSFVGCAGCQPDWSKARRLEDGVTIYV